MRSADKSALRFSVSAALESVERRGIFSTAPPEPLPPRGFRRLREGASRVVSTFMLPLVKCFGRAFIGGETIEDAMCVAGQLGRESIASTLGFWDIGECTGRQVADVYMAAVDRLATSGLYSYVSIKPPALRFDVMLASELAAAANRMQIRLQFDSHGPELVDPSHALLDTMLKRASAKGLGATLPGRWSRSLSDADWVIERGLNVRVVKGQWPDPANPGRDMRTGFLEVIDRLSGRVPHVAVATHDMPLAEKAIARLREAGTSCELEQLLGISSIGSRRWAATNGVDLRIYVPFGKGYIPNAVGAIRRNPRMLYHILTAPRFVLIRHLLREKDLA